MVVLFKNRVKQKILNKFKTYKRVNQYFKDLEKKSNAVIFDRHYDNGVKCDYQLGLLQKVMWVGLWSIWLTHWVVTSK